MAELDPRTGARQHLSVLRGHVLEPLSTAETVGERERVEVARERDAFQQFADRVADISPTSPQPPALRAGTVNTSVSTSKTEELREAYEETVMAVSHYDEVYGESVEENAVAEFGPDLASLLVPRNDVSFTEPQKQALVGVAEQRAADRDEFCSTLDSELNSLDSMRDDLTAVLDTLDSSIVPAWYREQFEKELTQVLSARQSTLGSRSSVSYTDGHSLCDYLYDEESWTYPGLTAVARLLDSVTVRDSDYL